MIRRLPTLLVAASLLSAPAVAGAADEPTPLDRALERYWGEVREPPTLRWRLHPKASRAEIALQGVVIPDDPFRSYMAPGVAFSYFVAETFSLGVSGCLPLASFSELGEFLDTKFPRNQALDEEEQVGLLAGVDLAWMPFYGKLSFLGYKFAHFDLGVTAGVGVAQTRFLDRGADSVGITPAGHLGLGFRFHPVKWVTVRLGYREHFVLSRTEEGGLLLPSALSFGIGTMFPYPEDRP